MMIELILALILAVDPFISYSVRPAKQTDTADYEIATGFRTQPVEAKIDFERENARYYTDMAVKGRFRGLTAEITEKASKNISKQRLFYSGKGNWQWRFGLDARSWDNPTALYGYQIKYKHCTILYDTNWPFGERRNIEIKIGQKKYKKSKDKGIYIMPYLYFEKNRNSEDVKYDYQLRCEIGFIN